MRLQGKRVISFVEAEFEDLELWYPVLRLREEGARVDIVGPKLTVYIGKYGIPAPVDLTLNELKPEKYDAILIPGGWAPDKLRRIPEVIAAVQHAHKKEKPIGQICHAGWVLISADIIKGKRVTSTPGIRHDMENAGGIWVDEAVVVDGHLVSSRRPPDLPVYAKAFCDLLANKKENN